MMVVGCARVKWGRGACYSLSDNAPLLHLLIIYTPER